MAEIRAMSEIQAITVQYVLCTGEIQPIRARKAGVKILKRHLGQCPKLMYSKKQTITRLFF
jgi:hypothetical protein